MLNGSIWGSIIKYFLGIETSAGKRGASPDPSINHVVFKFPFFIKAPMVLLGMYLLFYLLQILQDILVPICFALLIAVILNPIVNKLIQWKWPRPLAIGVSLLLAILVFAGVITFLTVQFASFSELAPKLEARGAEILQDLKTWLSAKLGISFKTQEGMLNDGLEQSKSYIGATLASLAEVLSTLVLLPIYIFLILYYKPLFINFFYEVFDYKHGKRVSDVLNETKSAVQSYIQGIMIETLIVAVLNSVALLIIGVQYAILLGVIGALLNLIPYIGGLIAIALPIIMSLVTGDSVGLTTPLIIFAAYSLIQFVDNNIIVPKVVSSKVEVNALISIIIVLCGGALWGVSGMFLSIPFVAILKIIFDRIEELQPWGLVLGTKMNPDFSLDDIGTTKAAIKTAINESAEEPDVKMHEI
jgi:predicted PurR-regulated permease PerM